MRLAQPTSSRPAYYDRNPSQQTIKFGGDNVAPHASTQRATYTSPSTRKAMLDLMTALVLRKTAAAPVGRVRVSILITTGGGITLAGVEIMTMNNNIGAGEIQTVAGSTVILPGETVRIETEDLSTGGTNDFRVYAKILEFDA